MTIIKRFGYYLSGFSIGLVILAFFLSGKKTSCAYGPSARVKKSIKIKDRLFSDEVSNLIKNKSIDTSTISYLLSKGSVNFSKSNTKLDSCKIYVIEGDTETENIVLTIENCETKATIQKAIIKKAQ